MRVVRALKPKEPAHLVNAGVSFIGLVAMCIMAGELMEDIFDDEENFPSVPRAAKPFAVLVFLVFAALEANKVRDRLTRARGFR